MPWYYVILIVLGAGCTIYTITDLAMRLANWDVRTTREEVWEMVKEGNLAVAIYFGSRVVGLSVGAALVISGLLG